MGQMDKADYAMKFDMNAGWQDMERRIKRTQDSLDSCAEYREIILACLDSGGDGCTWRADWEGFPLMNHILNEAIKDDHFLLPEYSSLCAFCGMFGFRFSEHFKLL